MTSLNLLGSCNCRVNRGSAGEGRGEPPGEESHSAVKVATIVRGSRVLANGAEKVPACNRFIPV